jgi:magnesium chelatase subunit D
MNPVSPERLAGWALALMAVAPAALGGARLRGGAGPARNTWLARLEATRHSDAAWLKLPLHAPDEALEGGLDLVATLVAGKPVRRQGLLALAQGGYLVAQMAERLTPARAARLAQALDMPPVAPGAVPDAVPGAAADTSCFLAGLCLVALDESEGVGSGGDDRPLAESLQDRLALDITLPPGRPPAPQPGSPVFDRRQLQRARERWSQIPVSDAVLATVVQAATALGLHSVRAPLQALVACRVLAALRGATSISDDDVVLAAQLVLAPRARQLPSAPADEAPAQEETDASTSPSPDDTPQDSTTPRDEPPDSAQDWSETPERANHEQQPLDDRVVAAALASMPAGLLAQLSRQPLTGPRSREAGRVGSAAASAQRGRPVGSKPGTPRGGARLALVDTLRAAAPWQRVRREQEASAQPRTAGAPTAAPAESPRVRVCRDDLRVQRRQQRSGTTTVFAIDASGSQAMHRLAEAKGAVELLLADCYARRDRVAVIGFRGTQAQVLLPPTRSLVLARRQLAGLPGGGGTPLALGIDAATALATAIRRQGSTPLLVLLTDGKANINRAGEPGRVSAQADADSAARAWSAQGLAALVIDTSPHPGPSAPALAERMQARCIALPHAGAQAVSAVVRAERGTAGPGAARRVG